MVRIDGEWLLSQLEEDATMVVNLSEIAESLLE
jgi:hypothetical protein